MRVTAPFAIGILLAALGAGCAGPGARTGDTAASDRAASPTPGSADGSTAGSTAASLPGRGGAPTASGDSAGLVDVDWALTELEGTPVSTAAGTTPTLRLTTQSGALSATGLAGCNRFRGPVTLSGGELRFGPLASTKMACPALELETRFLGGLDLVRGFRLADRQLELLAGERVVARFAAP